MKKVDDFIKNKMKKEPDFKLRYDLIKQKAKIAKKVIEYRIKHNLNQAQLAKEIGVTQQYISKIEEGDFSNINTVEDILHHLGLKLEIKVIPLQIKKVHSKHRAVI